MTLSPKTNNDLSNENIVPFIVKRPKSSTGYSSLNKARTRQTLNSNCSHKRRDQTFAFLKSNFELNEKSRVNMITPDGGEVQQRFSSM